MACDSGQADQLAIAEALVTWFCTPQDAAAIRWWRELPVRQSTHLSMRSVHASQAELDRYNAYLTAWREAIERLNKAVSAGAAVLLAYAHSEKPKRFDAAAWRDDGLRLAPSGYILNRAGLNVMEPRARLLVARVAVPAMAPEAVLNRADDAPATTEQLIGDMTEESPCEDVGTGWPLDWTESEVKVANAILNYFDEVIRAPSCQHDSRDELRAKVGPKLSRDRFRVIYAAVAGTEDRFKCFNSRGRPKKRRAP